MVRYLGISNQMKYFEEKLESSYLVGDWPLTLIFEHKMPETPLVKYDFLATKCRAFDLSEAKIKSLGPLE